MTVKSLAEELNKLKEQLKDYETLKVKLDNLEIELKHLKRNEKPITNEKEVIKCKKCDQIFDSMKTLKKHDIEAHAVALKCKLCRQTFSVNRELEAHMDKHEVKKKYKCDICDKEFSLEWRLKKHAGIHENATRHCQYFIAGAYCPYEKVGCMFRHELDHINTKEAEPQWNVADGIGSDIIITEKESVENDDVETEKDEEIQENQCHLCMK